MYPTRLKKIYEDSAQPSQTTENATLGTVVDTNDPQQMGRVRVVCPTWGDSMSSPVDEIPWALYMTPFGGQVGAGTRGSGIQESQGGISYGMWAIPKVGAQVVVMCIDGDPQQRIYCGCVFDQLTPHTLPHGRWMYDDHPALEKKTSDDAAPYGPYTSREKFIEPLHENMRAAYGYGGEPNHEWRSRAADYQVAAIDPEHLENTLSNVADDKDVSHSDWTSTQGYQVSRIDPFAATSVADKNYDSMVYSWTSPGFHAISMDDRQENCRVRFRTMGGHQILLDDTNERVLIMTAKGKNWIEMDQEGNIDIFTSNKLSVHAEKEINFTSDETIRFHGKKGIHMYSEGDIRMETTANMQIKIAQSYFLDVTSMINQRSGSNMNLTSGSSMNLLASGNMLHTAANVHLNSGANPAAPASTADHAMWTNRVPMHEPWARTMTANDLTHSPELAYTDENVGRVERGNEIPRGRFWRR